MSHTQKLHIIINKKKLLPIKTFSRLRNNLCPHHATNHVTAESLPGIHLPIKAVSAVFAIHPRWEP